MASAQITIDQNLQDLSDKPLKITPKNNITIIEVEPTIKKTIGVRKYGRRGFTLYTFGGVFFPFSLKFVDYTDDNVVAADTSNTSKRDYDQNVLSARGNAELEVDIGYGGGLAFGYDFQDIDLSFNGYIAYLGFAGNWSEDYTNGNAGAGYEFIDSPGGWGIASQGWDYETSNIVAAIGTYYNIVLGDTISIGLGGDVGINYALANLTYSADLINSIGNANIGDVFSGAAGFSQTIDLSGIQGFTAPRVNFDIFIPLYKAGKKPSGLSAIIINFYVAYYISFNDLEFSTSPEEEITLDNGSTIAAGFTRTGKITGNIDGLGLGLGIGMQF